jgi:osmotically-inducible protein OsmY
MKFRTLLIALAFAAPLAGHAADPNADNTAKNQRDNSGQTLTPIDQSNDPADIKITADIRKMVVHDKTLSATAKNCKIITSRGGAVTLRGPVNSAQEKRTIGDHAQAAGATSVSNQLEVKPSK